MRPTRSPRRVALAVVAATAALLTASACGSSGGGKAPDNAAPGITFASGTATPGMVPDGRGPAMPGMSMPSTSSAAAAPAGPNAVTIDNFAFGPSSLTVKVGTTVTWTNHDEEPHTVVATDGTFRSPTLGNNATYTFTFGKAGTFAYVCSIHPFMHATVVVTQ
ncbi:cupredoxin family copper-binding protein [Nocardia sp. CDC153]|uniref:cupredoxin domain-containing protein n=1 Tax=Nocardia sp. CDC153 TaxID=3112167 RepID=UPI002DBC3398|nr:cupredoxin family copper-binding protein [Nocardia sp. CDC153]MEC3954064.1 cupredoxin family copper-binding protein [Nocardia sp. CDC153]